MSRAAGLVEPGPDVASEDMLRARCYRLLARFLSSPQPRMISRAPLA